MLVQSTPPIFLLCSVHFDGIKLFIHSTNKFPFDMQNYSRMTLLHVSILVYYKIACPSGRTV